MKRFALFTLLCLSAVPLLAQNPIVPVTRPRETWPQQFDSIHVTDRPFQRLTVLIWNFSATDTLFFARESDTLRNQLIPIPPGASVRLDPWNSRWVRRKSTGAAGTALLVIH